jgi:hypothetical protein
LIGCWLASELEGIDFVENSKISSFCTNLPQLGRRHNLGINIPKPRRQHAAFPRHLELADSALAATIPNMRQVLKLHPDSLCSAATHIEVDVARPRASSLVMRYFVMGKISDLHMPPVTASARTDELWQQTCFEAFVRISPGTGYYEFNFAPSTQWAAYWFSGYRTGMRVAAEISAPQIEMQSSRECYTLQASLELDRLSSLPRDAEWRLGLSALIEERSGRKSYWALAHPPGKADFHHPDCFVYELSPA